MKGQFLRKLTTEGAKFLLLPKIANRSLAVDADVGEVVIVYDAVWTRGGTVQKRRFEAREPVGEVIPTNVAPAMNRAANRVAKDVAAWMGG